MSDERSWEPPTDGTEAEQLLGALDRLRATFRWKAGGLDDDGLALRVGVSSLTLGGLLKHLALVEDLYATRRLDGSPPRGPWDPTAWDDDPDWEFASAATDSAAELDALYDDAVARSRERLPGAITSGGLGQQVHLGQEEGVVVSLRRLILDLVEEYGRHTGHADLVRESVDGLVGEDPPPGWPPDATAPAGR